MNNSTVMLIATFMFAIGSGVLIHDYLHDMWVIGGYSELLSWQGGYFGTAIMIVGWAIIIVTYRDKKRKKVKK